MNHAYLIMAHNEFEVLQYLIDCIDDVRNSIYVHIDKKVISLPQLKCDFSELFILENRIDVRWGHFSQIEAELNLFKTAISAQKYSFFHLISGSHLPIYSQNYLHDFFDQNLNKNFLMYMPTNSREVEMKLHRYNFFVRNFMHASQVLKRVNQLIWHVFLKIQDILHINRNIQSEFIKASQWVSLNYEAVKYLVDYERQLYRTYKYTFCGDEFFVRTELTNSYLKDSLIDFERFLKCDFEGTSPRIYNMDDYQDLLDSGCFFARKFSHRHLDIVKKMAANHNH